VQKGHTSPQSPRRDHARQRRAAIYIDINRGRLLTRPAVCYHVDILNELSELVQRPCLF